MPRVILNPKMRKRTISLSIEQWIIDLQTEKGSRYIVDAIHQGLWAKGNNVNQFTIENIRKEYERKISVLQKVIEDGQA